MSVNWKYLIMKNIVAYYSFIALCFTALFTSCQKEVVNGDDGDGAHMPTCAYATTENKTILEKKWGNTFTKIDTYGTTGNIQSATTINPVGFFQLNSDGTYNVFSNNATLNGSWAINKNCQLVLDSGNVALQRNFDILGLSNDSLTIRRKQGNVVYTQHYRTFSCPDASKLLFTWNNAYIRTDYLFNNVLTGSSVEYPIGYFKLNADASYNVLSNGAPLNGKWMINTSNCRLVLDKNTTLERSFEILQLTSDSLTIRRKDTSNKAVPVYYTQHYNKQ